MHVIAAVIDQGALTFDFAIPCEVFGLDRSDIVDPWYEFLVVAARERRVRTQTGFVVEATHGLRSLVVAGGAAVAGARARAARGRRAWRAHRLDLHRCIRPGGGRTARRQARHDA